MQAMSEPWVGGKPVSQTQRQNQGQQQQRPEGWRDFVAEAAVVVAEEAAVADVAVGNN